MQTVYETQPEPIFVFIINYIFIIIRYSLLKLSLEVEKTEVEKTYTAYMYM